MALINRNLPLNILAEYTSLTGEDAKPTICETFSPDSQVENLAHALFEEHLQSFVITACPKGLSDLQR